MKVAFTFVSTPHPYATSTTTVVVGAKKAVVEVHTTSNSTGNTVGYDYYVVKA